MNPARRTGLVAIAIGIVLAALLHGAGFAPPLFDGIALPPQPYRWVSPPPDQRASNQPPQSGDGIFLVSNGQVSGGGVQTTDNQVVLFFAPGVFRASPAARTVLIRVDPVKELPAPPSGAQIRGNVYRVAGVEQPGGAPLTVSGSYHLRLQYPGNPFTEIQFFDGSQWHPLPTTRAPSSDPYATASLTAFGEVAATAPAGAAGDSLFTIVARYVEFFGIVAFVIVFGVIAAVQEIRRRRKQRG